jgi:hypothetical protein
MGECRLRKVQHHAIQGEALAAVESCGVRQSQWELTSLDRPIRITWLELKGDARYYKKKVGMSVCAVPCPATGHECRRAGGGGPGPRSDVDLPLGLWRS